ncbi:MAG TPA: alcohol dehydrogenase catalytic domain-containing protein [Propionibacteriaceae bacterium]|jgi:2-desacetyl-2-hydroxyethyl bacteriochlorophyllide A dehydrogenase
MTGTKIRRVVVESIHNIVVEQVDGPTPGLDEVLVASAVVGICGSDMHAVHGEHPFVTLPMRPGHEVVGRVVAAGPGAGAALVNTRVVVEPNLACGVCPQCTAGRYNICSELLVFGCQTAGGMTDRFVIAADRVVPLPDDLDDTWAALVEPAATPMHAVRRAGDLGGRRVAVLGAGPIGLFVVLAALRAGAAAVVAGDLVESKRARAVRLGACGTFEPGSAGVAVAADEALAALGGPADVVFDCVSVESTVRLAIMILAKGGLLMTVGVPAGPTRVDLDLIQDRELTLMGNLMYVREDVLAAIALLRTRPFALEEVVTATYNLDDVASAFRAADDPEQMKVLVTIGP